MDNLLFGLPFFGENKEPFGSFKEFILSESITPKQTNYGSPPSDFRDRTYVSNNGLIYTFFKSNGSVYIVVLNRRNNNEITFTKVENVDTLDLVTNVTNDFNQYRIFGKVMYIVLMMLTQMNLGYVTFKGLTKKHEKIYNLLLANKNFLKTLGNFGYGAMIEKKSDGLVFKIEKSKDI